MEVNFRSDHKVELVNFMGGDDSVVRSAKVSFNSDTEPVSDERREGLIRFLYENQHMSPFEHSVFTFLVETPLFVRSEFMRHRAACLAGDSVISFSRPDNGRHYPYRLDRLHKNWNDPPQRARLRDMKIRSVNEDTGEIIENRLVDVTASGVKQIYEVALSNGNVLRGSKDHRVFTVDGWQTIGNLIETPVPVKVSGRRAVTTAQIHVAANTTRWLPVPGFEGMYEVSDGGEVRSLRNTRGSDLVTPLVKKRTVNTQGYLCASLSRNGVSRMYTVHSLVALAFLGPRPQGMEVRHADGNRLNANLANLSYGTAQDNADDRIRHGATTRLWSENCDIASITEVGYEETYDIAVEGPWHNFFANGVVVHNSYNEISGRYSELPLDFYLPDPGRPLQQTGKAGNYSFVEGTYSQKRQVAGDIMRENTRAAKAYQGMLKAGVAKEVARMVLSVNTYTRFYTTMNTRNLMHFLDLRTHPTALYEIRAVANQMENIFSKKMPVTYAAWKNI